MNISADFEAEAKDLRSVLEVPVTPAASSIEYLIAQMDLIKNQLDSFKAAGSIPVSSSSNPVVSVFDQASQQLMHKTAEITSDL